MSSSTERPFSKNRRIAKLQRAKRRLVLVDPCCIYCRRPLYYDHPEHGRLPDQKYATLDHLVPISKGGTDDDLNLVLACSACNVAKGDRTPREWADMIRRVADELEERVASVRFWTFSQSGKRAGVECLVEVER